METTRNHLKSSATLQKPYKTIPNHLKLLKANPKFLKLTIISPTPLELVPHQRATNHHLLLCFSTVEFEHESIIVRKEKLGKDNENPIAMIMNHKLWTLSHNCAKLF